MKLAIIRWISIIETHPPRVFFGQPEEVVEGHILPAPFPPVDNDLIDLSFFQDAEVIEGLRETRRDEVGLHMQKQESIPFSLQSGKGTKTLMRLGSVE